MSPTNEYLAELAALRARVKELEEAPLNLPGAAEAKKAVAENAKLRELLAKARETLEHYSQKTYGYLEPEHWNSFKEGGDPEIGDYELDEDGGIEAAETLAEIDASGLLPAEEKKA